MSTPNPDPPEQPAAIVQLSGVFVHQQTLVFRLGDGELNLPLLCIKSGEPASDQEPLEIDYVPQWVLAVVMAGVFVCSLTAVLLLIFRRKVRFVAGLSPGWLAYRRRLRARARLTGLTSLLAFACGGLAWVHHQGPGYPWASWGLGLLGGLGLVGAAYWGFCGNLLYAKEVRNGWVRLAGVHPEFLAQFPPWPGVW